MYPKAATPLIIVGRQRAGTRFLTNILNSFNGVSIQPELPNPVMHAAADMMRTIQSYYARMAETGDARQQRYYDRWLRKRENLIFSIWENASQGGPVKFTAKTRYFGYKRPNNETYFAFYEALFRSRPPMYVYCTRNFTDNYLSIVSRWPERTIEQVADDYLKSTAQYQLMVADAPRRVLLFNLDDHVKYGFEYIENRIVAPLDLQLKALHRRRLERMGPRNRTEEDLNVPRRKVLTSGEEEYIRAHPELDREFGKLCISSAARDEPVNATQPPQSGSCRVLD